LKNIKRDVKIYRMKKENRKLQRKNVKELVEKIFIQEIQTILIVLIVENNYQKKNNRASNNK